jgi:hypothetical protein
MPDGRAIEFGLDKNGILTVLIAVAVDASPKVNREMGEKFSQSLPEDLLQKILK